MQNLAITPIIPSRVTKSWDPSPAQRLTPPVVNGDSGWHDMPLEMQSVGTLDVLDVLGYTLAFSPLMNLTTVSSGEGIFGTCKGVESFRRVLVFFTHGPPTQITIRLKSIYVLEKKGHSKFQSLTGVSPRHCPNAGSHPRRGTQTPTLDFKGRRALEGSAASHTSVRSHGGLEPVMSNLSRSGG